ELLPVVRPHELFVRPRRRLRGDQQLGHLPGLHALRRPPPHPLRGAIATMHALLLIALTAGSGRGHTDLPMPPAPALKKGPKPIRVAVLDPAVDPSVDPRVKAAVGQGLTAEVRKLEGITAIAAEEIQQMVAFQRSRQLMGCSEDTSCMAELVDALAADDLISLRVTTVGQSVTFAVQRLDARRAKVAPSVTKQGPKGSGGGLVGPGGPP